MKKQIRRRSCLCTSGSPWVCQDPTYIYIYLIHIYMHIYINKITQSMIAHPLAHRTSRTSINNYERPSPTKPWNIQLLKVLFFGALGILSPGYSKLRPGIPKPRVRNWILQAPMRPCSMFQMCTETNSNWLVKSQEHIYIYNIDDCCK